MKQAFPALTLTNSFSKLGPSFFSRISPTPFATPAHLLHFNSHAAELIELDLNPGFGNETVGSLVEVFSGKQSIPGSDPIAMLYAGHQFGHFVPQLGDGRAIMLGEVTNSKRQLWEIQLKGSGLTPYSRDGDGRAVLRSSIREYLCSEAMYALGIPTTRALCLLGSNDEVYRERIESGAMLTRLAPSHVRFGSFEVFYYRNQFDLLQQLADYVIATHYPAYKNTADAYLCLLREVIARTAALIARWQAVGFCHGVMNSDNMSILGLTLDYGPFAFMEAYEPGYVCNHSDYQGRYAYNQQAKAGLFNLSCLAQAMLPLLDEIPEQAAVLAQNELEKYYGLYANEYSVLMRHKMGLSTEMEGDHALLESLLLLMAQDKVDYTILFRRLCDFNNNSDSIRNLFVQHEAINAWLNRYSQRLDRENSQFSQRSLAMKQVNPKYILRNYMAEIAIRAAEDEQDFTELGRLFDLLRHPYDEQPDNEKYAAAPPDWSKQIAISCSS